jgi:arsenate reductase
MSEWTIYHNPRCSKSRQALELLRAAGIEPAIVEYLRTPLDVTGLRRLLRLLGAKPRDIIRDGEDEYVALRLAEPTRTDEELLAALAAHPVLMQRPIVVRGSRAVVGRPTERIRELL